MTKADRSKTDEVYVCGFVPNYLLPSKMPWCHDPFLHPLIVDIEEAFINGMNITKIKSVASYVAYKS